jgi:type IV pilus assembly protein PilF
MRQLYVVLPVFMAIFMSLFVSGCPSGASRTGVGIQAGSPEQQLVAFTQLGAALLSEGDLMGALSELSKAEQIDPNNAEVSNYLGITYYYRNELPKAIEYYEKALRLDPKKTDVHNNMGLVYLRMKNYEEAKRHFNLCLADPTYSKPFLAQYNLGLAEEAQGNMAEAEELYRRVIVINPQYPQPHFRLAQFNYNRGDIRVAVDYLLSAVRLDASFAEAFFLLGQAYERLNLPDEAAEAYGQVVVSSPNSAIAMEAQSRARRVLGFD